MPGQRLCIASPARLAATLLRRRHGPGRCGCLPFPQRGLGFADERIVRRSQLHERAHRADGTRHVMAENVLLNYVWPGNVRELRNVIEETRLLASTEVIKPAGAGQNFIELHPRLQV